MREQKLDYYSIKGKLDEFLQINHLSIKEVEESYIILQRRLINLLSIAEQQNEGCFIEDVELKLFNIHLMIKFLRLMKYISNCPRQDRELKENTIKKVEGYFDTPETENFTSELRDAIIDIQFILLSLLRIADKTDQSNLEPVNDSLVEINLAAEFFFSISGGL